MERDSISRLNTIDVTEVSGMKGKEIFTFKTLKKGVSTIDFKYSRPWEGGEKGEWTFKLEVHIRERS